MKKRISNNVYKEVYSILLYKKDITDKIPDDILIFIKKKASASTYKVNFESEKDILECVSDEAFNLYLVLYLRYIASVNEKKLLKELLIKNELKLI